MLSLRSFVFLSLFAQSFAATANDWKSRSIYQLVTDRFAHDDGSTPQCDPQQRVYCGGTWKGVTGKLDYIKDMGFDAVWISPIVRNVNGTTAYGEAYHGYWTSDINALNEHYGTADDLKDLSTQLHNRGMYLMVDVVVNHFVPENGTVQDLSQNLNTTFNFASVTPFGSTTNYHSYCLISDYNNQTDVEQCWLGDDKLPLPDLNTEDDAVVKQMYDWISGIVKEYNIDGVRIDTVKHVRKDFWPGFRDAAGVYTIGEVISDDPTYAAAYTKVLDSVLDYPTYFPLFTAFQSPSGNLSSVIDLATRSQSAYANASTVIGAFIENHDQVRFQSTTKDMSLVKNIMAWPFVGDGMPILYYGQEQGYAGGADPGNREALWSSGYSTSSPLVKHAQTLNLARKAAIKSNSNFFSTPASFLSLSPTTLAVSKPPLLTLLSNAGSNSTSTSWSITKDQNKNFFSAGATLVDLLTCNTFVADKDGGVTVTADAAAPRVLIPAKELGKDAGVCSDVAGTGAGNSAGSVRVGGSVVFGLVAGLGFLLL